MLRCIQKPFRLIAAVSSDYGLGYKGAIPWTCKTDLAHFRDVTKSVQVYGAQNAVIMGRKTWESLPHGWRPLPDRCNVVITRNYEDFRKSGVHAFPSLLEATMWLSERGDIENQFIIGGAELYKEALQKNWSKELLLTHVPGNYQCDTFFPDIPHYYKQICNTVLGTECGGEVELATYKNYYGRHYEEQYVHKMRELLYRPMVPSRNAPVYSDFQWQFQMDLSDGLPLFSTRKGFWKGICKELLFFIHGDTNSKHLEQDGIRIWKGNTTTEFLKSRGLPYEEGDMGPMYGWVWRHYGARYQGMNHDYTGEGFDQLRDVVHKLLHDPNSRRILMTSYEPSKVAESVLAPCHSIVNHFYVRNQGDVQYLDMYTYQRSADMFLGVYFNLPSDATLQTIIAKAVGMTPGKMHVQLGDTHVYAGHKAALEEQLMRTPEDILPRLEIQTEPELCMTKPSTDSALSWIESLTYEDFKVIGYKPQGHIKAEMVA